MGSKVIDMVGAQCGFLTVISRAPTHFTTQNRPYVMWNCICKCGKQIIVRASSLRNGHTVSCGCMKKLANREIAKKFVSKNPRLTSAWAIYTKYDDGDITFDQFLGLSQKPCHYCNTGPLASNLYNRYRRKTSCNSVLEDINVANFHYNGLDRIDSSKSHLLNNVVPCCKNCNFAKRDRSYNDFIDWIKTVYHNLIQKEKDLDCSKSFSELSVS